jgi:hypothetical protein
MSFIDRFKFKKQPGPAEIVGIRPELLRHAQDPTKGELWAHRAIPKPVQQIPQKDIDSLLESKKKMLPKKIEKPPEENIRDLLEWGEDFPAIMSVDKVKPIEKVPPWIELNTPSEVVPGEKVIPWVELDIPAEVMPVEEVKPRPEVAVPRGIQKNPATKKVEKAPIGHLLDWLRGRKEEKTTVQEPISVEILKETPRRVEVEIETPPSPVEAVGKKKEFIPDPPPQKGKKNKIQVEALREKKKVEEPKPKKALTYEEAVEEYERNLSKGKASTTTTKVGPVIPVAPARFSRAEINKLMIIKVMPSFVRAFLAKRGGVPFMSMCGIYRLEFIQIVSTREEGHKIMADLKDALDYESILETYPKRTGGVVLAVYSRAKMKHQGRYSGTPLRPRLEERT